ncbi:MAG: N-succinylarginine dihydrolase [Parachlamydiaceae bacterium]|nr:N-succinylarginine dihydrolase [Parachlamydiaceae bacterium]
MSFEVNFDALVGPTHNYSGLAYGNIASKDNQLTTSNPQAAALQGLEKMRFLDSLGIKQGIIPPQRRPLLDVLRSLGYRGQDDEILLKAWKLDPHILLSISSAASMWAANSATVTPSCDSNTGLVHITPANLSSKFHRAIEAPATGRILKTIFSDSRYFVHHEPLPSGTYFSDEGAANHTCFNRKHGTSGVHLFVYGRTSFQQNLYSPKLFPARQTLEASQAIARLHQIDPKQILFLQQNPLAIDAGAFHNDVIAVGNNIALLYHEKAFCNEENSLEKLGKAILETCNFPMQSIRVTEKQVPLKDAIESYLFNSQLVTLPDFSMALITPMECQGVPSVYAFLNELTQNPGNSIGKIHYFNLHQSMRNGGGPACLRLRIVLTEAELQAVNPHYLFTEELYDKLVACIKKHYRTSLVAKDLADPVFFKEAQAAYDALDKIFS